MDSIGSVSVDVRANLGPLEQGVQQAQRTAQAADRAISQSMGNISRAVAATAQSTASLGKGFSAAAASGKMTWTQFLKENLAAYQRLEGSGGAAMKRLSVEWKEYKDAVAAGGTELARFVAQQAGAGGPSPQQLLGIGGTGRTSLQAASDLSAYSQQLDGLRTKYSPLFAAQQQYREALAEIKTGLTTGALSQKEYETALVNTKVAFVQQVNAINGLEANYRALNATTQTTANNTTAVATTEQVLSKALMTTVGDLNVQAVALKNNTTMAAGGAHGHTMLSTQAMAAAHSMRGMTEMMIMGVPVYQALGMEVNNLTYAMSHPGGLLAAMKEGLSAFKGFLSPMVLVAGGAAAVAGAFYLIYSSIKSTELEFANVSDKIGETVQQLHGLSSAASFQGIGQADFLPAMEKFGQMVDQAQKGMGGMAELFRANNRDAKTFTDYLATAADLVRNASTQQERYQLLQQMGLPQTYQWVQYLSQGGDAIRRAAAEANNYGSVAERAMIAKAREFDTAWARSWDHFKDEAKSAVISAVSWLDTLSQKANGWLMGVADRLMTGGAHAVAMNILKNTLQFGGGTQLTQTEADKFQGLRRTTSEGAPLKVTVDPSILIHNLQLQQQRISMLGELATVDDKVRAKEIALQLAYLQTGASVGRAKDLLLEMVRVRAQEQDLGQRAEYGLVSAQDAQRQALAELDLVSKQYNMTAAQQAGALNALERKYRDLADASAVAASKFPEMTRAALDATNATRQLGRFGSSAIDSLSESISGIVSGAKTMGEAFRSAAISIVANFTQMIVKASLYRAALALIPGLGGAAPTGGGLLGGALIPGILHAGGAVDSAPVGPPMAASYFADAPKFAAGLSKRAPGINEVPILAHKGEVVGWPDQMRAVFGGGGAKVINVNLTMDLTGANGDAAIARAAAAAGQAAVQQAAQQLSEYDRRLPARLRDVRVRGA